MVSQKQYYEKSVNILFLAIINPFSQYYSCLEAKAEDEDGVQRSSSISESCDPNLPGTEENNKEIEEPIESNNDLEAETEE